MTVMFFWETASWSGERSGLIGGRPQFESQPSHIGQVFLMIRICFLICKVVIIILPFSDCLVHSRISVNKDPYLASYWQNLMIYNLF